tara:strand:+ start:5001 stop:5321 length:321 start_codon:yes stop_codon:yes gene_type:complete
MININNEHKILELVKTDNSTYAQLSLISEQMNFLKKQAENIMEKHVLSKEATNASCKFKKSPGNYYYLYKHNSEFILSLVSPNEGTIYDTFICGYYYDYDYIMKPI